MMSKIVYFLFIVSIPLLVNAQSTTDSDNPDSWKQQLLSVKTDSSKLTPYLKLGSYYQFNDPDSAIYYAKKGFVLSREFGRPGGECWALRTMALAMRSYGNDPIALQINLKRLKLAEQYDIKFDQALSLGQIGEIYVGAGNYEKALNNFYQSQKIMNKIDGVRPSFLLLAQNRIIQAYLLMDQLDSVEIHATLAKKSAVKLASDERWPIPSLYVTLGDLERKKGNLDRAKNHYLESIKIYTYSESHYKLAQLYLERGQHDSSIFHINHCLELLSSGSLYSDIAEAYGLLSTIYESSDPQKAYFFSDLARAYQDSLFNISRTVALERFIDFDQEERQNEMDIAEAEFENRIRTNALLGGSFTLLVIAFFLYRNNRQNKRSKRRVEIAFGRLKNTQSQLIQSEKMASLGELTAGIAHEIQNPLNFVNNFSEVNNELIDELNDELNKGDIEEAKSISKDIKENEQKIKHHGLRASGIVKGMLEHSRTGDGVKEPTDINALADEYLRLAYHGLRAKDKSFNADFSLDLDKNLPKIKVIPQDIGRVLLNLINNAFYAVAESSKLEARSKEYKPEVMVSTKKLDDKVEVRISDNGPGIPEQVRDKIFQPFFTTKPTGSGTGLGLSLSYDIVKAHGGELIADSKKGDGTEFIIQLPLV